MRERHILENLKGRSDSIEITNYDINNHKIDTVILGDLSKVSNKEGLGDCEHFDSRKSFVVEDTIPDEDGVKPLEEYVLPQKQYIRSLSVKEPNGERKDSRGPKLKFDHKIERKSKCRDINDSTLISDSRRNHNENTLTNITNNTEYNIIHRPKI
jgi:hypothetical protein